MLALLHFLLTRLQQFNDQFYLLNIYHESIIYQVLYHYQQVTSLRSLIVLIYLSLFNLHKKYKTKKDHDATILVVIFLNMLITQQLYFLFLFLIMDHAPIILEELSHDQLKIILQCIINYLINNYHGSKYLGVSFHFQHIASQLFDCQCLLFLDCDTILKAHLYYFKLITLQQFHHIYFIIRVYDKNLLVVIC